MPKKAIPTYVPIHEEGEGTVYISSNDALQDPEIGSQIADYAIAELAQWYNQWGTLLKILNENHSTSSTKCGSAAVESYERLKQQHKKDWPV